MASKQRESQPLMFEMKEHEEMILSADKADDLNLSLMEEAQLCQASCLSDPQTTAKTALTARQLRLYHDAISDERFDPAYPYHTGDGFPKTLMVLAIEQWASELDSQFITLLIANGAKVDEVDESTELAPLHLIMKKRDPGLLEGVLGQMRGREIDVNVKDGEGLTPLHTLVEQLQDCDEPERATVLQVLKCWLRISGVETNAEDLRGGLTPLYYAATSGYKEAIEVLLEHGADPDVQIEGINIRDVISEHIPGFDFFSYAAMVKKRPLQQKLFNCVEMNDVNGLRRHAYFSSKDEVIDWNCSNGAMTLLQMAALHGHDRVVEFLLKRECDPNLTTPTERRTPILIAAHHGYYKVLDVFKAIPNCDFSIVESTSGKTVLHEVFRCDSAKFVTNPERRLVNSSYPKCLKVLLGKAYKTNPAFERQITNIINFQEDLEGNTALHYATMQADQEVIKMFLKRGANMGVKNFRDKTPVQSILPETLEEFLDDECIDGSGIITDEDFKITFKYDFLAPPILNQDMAAEMNANKSAECDQDDARALPETEALWYLSTASKDHRALLKHPVIASFLWLKWQRIRTLFYCNLLLYINFVVLLTSFIFIRFGGFGVQPIQVEGEEANEFNGSHKTTTRILTVLLTCLLGVLVFREVFQMFVSFKRYFLSPENLMELTIIVISFVVLFDNSEDTFGTRRHLAALCVLLTWTETLVLIGRHPRLSTNITMFTTVISTFFAFLLWYGIIIVAFGISFYIMMHQDHKDTARNEEYPFFDTFWLALFKTSAMFVGELEFADIPFTDNILSYLIFLAFIFLIVVVLMNLLNGLAVSDTGLIRDEAEVVGWSSRVELITYTESMLLGDPFYFLSNWPPIKLLQKIPSCAVCRFLYKYPTVRDILQKISGGTKILLFYSCLPDKKATFFPNKKSRAGKGLLGYKKSLKVDDDENATNAARRQKLAISKDVLDSAKALLLQKMKEEKEEEERRQENEAINNRLLILEEIQLQLLATTSQIKSLLESKSDT